MNQNHLSAHELAERRSIGRAVNLDHAKREEVAARYFAERTAAVERAAREPQDDPGGSDGNSARRADTGFVSHCGSWWAELESHDEERHHHAARRSRPVDRRSPGGDAPRGGHV